MVYDPFEKLYSEIAQRKGEANSGDTYGGGNGRIDRAVDIIRKVHYFPKSGALLDVGGATGNLGYALRNEFEYRAVIDISRECMAPAVAKGNDFMAANVDLDGIPFVDGRFDLIVALDFIEHIINPRKFADECWRVLQPGGVVLINTPNIQYWRHLHSLVVDGIFPHTSGDQEVYHGGHVAFYNLHDMRNIFQNFDYQNMHLEGLKSDPPPPIWSAISKVGNLQMSYADLVFSCRKPT